MPPEMQEQLQGQLLSRFTPSLMQPEALEETFVQREDLASDIVERIAESGRTSSKHHTLLVGPRGIGKTHLVSLVYHRVRALPDFEDHLRVAWLREEEWGITSFLDLLIRILRALHEEYGDRQLAEKIEALYEQPKEEAEKTAGRLLRAYAADRTVLIIVENLKDVFEGLGETGQQQFRAYLQEHAFCTVLATAQSLFDGVSLRTSPFYGFFRVHHLQELSLDEAADLLHNIARWEGDDELAGFIRTPQGRARLRAVHHLGGGSPRVYVILSEFLTRESLDELVEPFMKMLDDLTPYYQARMSRLSPQQRKIIEFLVDNRGAAPVKKIAARCFVSHQTASGQLRKLRELGYVQSRRAGRASYYDLREPLMRFCLEVKKQRGAPIRLFVELLRIWYSETELQHQIDTLEPEAEVEREYLLRALHAYREEDVDPRVAQSKRDCDAHLDAENYEQALEAAEELVELRGNSSDWTDQASCLLHLGRVEQAEDAFKKAIDLDSENALAWSLWEHLQNQMGKHNDAVTSLERAIELEANEIHLEGHGVMWMEHGRALLNLSRPKEAANSLQEAIELDPEFGASWRLMGVALRELGNVERAEEAAAEALERNPGSVLSRYLLGEVLMDQGKFESALEIADEIVADLPESTHAQVLRGLALGSMGRFEEALKSFEQAVEHAPDYSRAWRGKGLSLTDLQRWTPAYSAFKKAIELGDEWSGVRFFAAAASAHTGKWDEAIELTDNALQKRRENAEEQEDAIYPLVRALLESPPDTWQERALELTAVCKRYEDALRAIGHALFVTIVEAVPPCQRLEDAKTWSRVWREIGERREGFELPLRLLDAAIEYRETEDERVLLELPTEERDLLKSMLEMSEEEEAGTASTRPEAVAQAPGA